MDSIDPKLSTIPTHSTTLCDVVKQGKTVLLLSRKYDIINIFYLSEEFIMNYKRINEHEIEIIPEETPIDKILVTMARVSYESAKPHSSDFLELLEKESKEIDFSGFVHLNSSKVLDIDYVNERQCTTKVRRTDDGKYIFDARLYESNRGKPEIFLNKVKSTLEEGVEDSVVSVGSNKSKKERQKRHGIAGLLDILELILDLFT